MKPVELTNFTVWGKQWFEDDWAGLRRFCIATGMDGIELLSAGATPETAPPDDLIGSVHLGSLGNWLLLTGLTSQSLEPGMGKYDQMQSYDEMVALRAAELKQAAMFKPDYVIWHGSYVTEDMESQPDLHEFLKRLAQLVSDTVEQSETNFLICFENAWGEGLSPDMLDTYPEFMEYCNGLPVGFCLDIGHHLNRHRDINTPEAACEELGTVAGKFASVDVKIDVLHLHWTPPELVPSEIPENIGKDCFFALQDQHKPLVVPELHAAVAALAPRWVVHEMGAMTLEDHISWLTAQGNAMRGLRV